MFRSIALRTLAVVLATALGPASALAAGQVDVVSRADGAAGAVTTDNLTYEATPGRMTADGTQSLFGTTDTSLVPGTPPASGDIYLMLRNIGAGTTTFAGRGDGAAGVVPNRSVLFASMAAGGRYVAFSTDATNMGPLNPSFYPQVYVRDTQTGATVLGSSPQGSPATIANDYANHPSLSADGRYLAFDSAGTNLNSDAGVTGRFQVFVKDLQTGVVSVVSRNTAGAVANSSGAWPQISADGTHVAFLSGATNLSDDATSGQLHLYVRDLVHGTTVLADREDGTAGAPMDYPANNNNTLPAISYDGTRVAFRSFGAGQASAQIYVRDIAAGTTVIASRATGAAGEASNGASLGDGLALSGNGRYAAFMSDGTNVDPQLGGGRHLFVRDLQTNVTTTIRVGNPVGPAFDESGCLLTVSSDDASFSGTLLDSGERLYRVRLCDVPATTTTPTPTPTTAATPAAATPPARTSSPVLPPIFGVNGIITGAPSTRGCLSRRAFRIRVRNLPGPVKFLSATVFVDGRKVAVRKGARLTAPVDLRRLPKGRYTVRISVKTSDGRSISDTRRYRTCTPKKKH